MCCALVVVASCTSSDLDQTITIRRGDATTFTIDRAVSYDADVEIRRTFSDNNDAFTHNLSVTARFSDGSSGTFPVSFGCFSDDSPTVELNSVTCDYRIVAQHLVGGTPMGPGVDGACTCMGGGKLFTWDSTKYY